MFASANCSIRVAGAAAVAGSRPFGDSIALSLAWTFRDATRASPALSLAAGVAIARALQRAGAQGIGLKWPNDVWFDDRKIGGVLLELRADASGPAHVVIGVGLNRSLSRCGTARRSRRSGVRAAAVADACTRSGARNRMAGLLLDELLSMLGQFEQEGFAPFRDAWMALDALRGRPAQVLAADGRHHVRHRAGCRCGGCIAARKRGSGAEIRVRRGQFAPDSKVMRDDFKEHRGVPRACQRGLFSLGREASRSPRSERRSSTPAATLKLASEAPAVPPPATAPDGGEAAHGGIVGASGGSEAEEATAHADASADLLTNVKRCISVGPFRDVAEAAHAASILRGGGYDPRQRVAEGEVWAGVWVYLPLPAGRSASDQMLAKLKAAGIEDALEMPGPNDASVISLGLYSDAKRAQTRVAQAQALGFNPGIADRKRTGNVYWIDIDLKPTDSVLKPSDLQGESGRIVRLEVKGCPAGAGAQP